MTNPVGNTSNPPAISGAAWSRTTAWLCGVAMAVMCLLAFLLPQGALADYEQVGLFGQRGTGEQINRSKGTAINATGAGGVEPGSVYVASGQHVSRYNAKGEIKEVWGWGTIAAGPDLPNQVDKLTVSATAGSYTLTPTTADGRGRSTEGSKVITDVRTQLGPFHVGDSLSFSGVFPPGATITSVGAETLEVSAAAIAGYSGRFTTSETTAPVPYSASADQVKAALVALPAFEAADLSVTGGPGDAEGTTLYEITGEGAFAGREFDLSTAGIGLAGGTPSSSATVTTVVRPHEGPAHFERCRVNNGDACTLQSNEFFEGDTEGIGRFAGGPAGIAIDQTTGYVYVLNAVFSPGREHNLIEVFSADGSEVIARFGDAPTGGETIESNPEKVSGTASIAVNETGTVYVGTAIRSGYNNYRVMCFRPGITGDYEHYVYCGRSQDIVPGFYAQNLAVDSAGHVYVAERTFLEELSVANPSAPLCTYATHGQAWSMTTNPLTGEVFYFNFNDGSIHRLKPCDPAKGKFEEAQAKIKVSPPSEEIPALAFNPNLSWGPNRQAGVLYGTAFNPFEAGGVRYEGLGYIFAPAEVRSPAVFAESFSNTRTTSTVLHAEINPNGFATRYVFQYLTAAQYEANPSSERFAGAMEAPVGGGEIGAGSVGSVAAAITGLSPDTAYRFRVIASGECNGKGGEPCTSEGEALAFATYPLLPPGLPDHRAYEMVSPAQKHGGEVLPAEPAVVSCLGPNGLGECKPNSFGNVFPMQSSPDGEAVAYEGQPFNSFEGAVNYDSYVSRRTASGWRTKALIPAQPPSGVKQLAFDARLDQGLLGLSGSSLALQPTSQPGSLTPLLSGEPHNRVAQLTYGGHSADFSRIFFAANDTLTEATPFAPEPSDPGSSKDDLYEWHEGQLAVVNVAPGNATVMAGAKFASTSPDTNAVSEDGSMIFFTDEAGSLYVRERGEVTSPINDAGHFLSASPDGSEVLLDEGCLYSVESETCTDLTEGQGGFKGILGQSKDLSRVYFVDGKALAAGAESGTCTRAPGGSKQDKEEREGKVPAGFGCNIYLYEAGAPVRFITTLPAFEGENGTPGFVSDWAESPAKRTAEASPNGRLLAFASAVSLTGYDNVGLCQVVKNEGKAVFSAFPCAEAFLYDAATDKLTCASCNPTGEAPLGHTTLRRIYNASEALPQPRYLTDEGRLYFDSQDSLSARDTNEGVEDVYEYSPQGAGAEGTCERESGCTRLISAGTEPVDSNLIAVDETGKNVFFDTRDKLALKDKDELLDIYDAREGGGIAAESEIARAECQGENCQAPVSPPNDPTPASSSFEGAGNVNEAPAAKKHSKKKKHAKKHKKKAKKHSRTAKRNHGGAK